MPLYEYICSDCGQPFEKMMRFSEANQSPACPTCASINTTKQLSLFASSGSSSATATASSCGTGSSGRFR